MKKILKINLTLVVFFLSTISFAGGGDVGGNGPRSGQGGKEKDRSGLALEKPIKEKEIVRDPNKNVRPKD